MGKFISRFFNFFAIFFWVPVGIQLIVIKIFFEVASRYLPLLLAVTLGLGAAHSLRGEGALDVEAALLVSLTITAALATAWRLIKYGVSRLHTLWREREEL